MSANACRSKLSDDGEHRLIYRRMLTTALSNIRLKVTPYLAKGGMRRAFLEVGAATVLARAISAVKEIAVARLFGVSVGVDAFALAVSIVGAIQGVIGNAIRPVLLPMLIEAGSNNPAAERRLATQTAFVILLGGFIFALALPHLFAATEPWLLRRASPRTLEQTTLMLDLLRWGLPFALMALWAGTVLERHKCFVLPTLVEAMPASGILVLLFVAVNSLAERALALGTVLGFVLAFVILATSAVRTGSVALKAQEVRGREPLLNLAGRRFLPMLGSGVFVSLITVTDSIVAAWQGEGAVAVLGYAQRIVAVVLGISGATIARIGLPYIAERLQVSDAAARQLLGKLVRAGLLSGFGLAVPLAMFAQPLTALLFERGAFTARNTAQVASVLFAYSWQIPFYLASIFQSQLLAAKGLQNRLMWVGVFNSVLNAVLDVFLARWLGVVGIAWATTAVVASAMIMYARLLRRSI